MEQEYDELTCKTAGQLRALGVIIDDRIPDCAWVPNTALKINALPIITIIDEKTLMDKSLGINIEITVTEPFRWIELKVVVEKNVPQL